MSKAILIPPVYKFKHAPAVSPKTVLKELSKHARSPDRVEQLVANGHSYVVSCGNPMRRGKARGIFTYTAATLAQAKAITSNHTHYCWVIFHNPQP